MKTDISSDDNAAARLSSQPLLSTRASPIVFALAVGACAVYAAANGPALWSTAQRQKIETLHQEDKLFCEKFHMPPGSDSFPMCVAYLAEIRSLHGDRVAADAAGMP